MKDWDILQTIFFDLNTRDMSSCWWRKYLHKILARSLAVRNCAGFEGPEGGEVFEQEGRETQLDDDSLPVHKSGLTCFQV